MHNGKATHRQDAAEDGGPTYGKWPLEILCVNTHDDKVGKALRSCAVDEPLESALSSRTRCHEQGLDEAVEVARRTCA